MASSEPYSKAVTQQQIWWLSAAVLTVLIPLAPFLPLWLSGVSTAAIAWRGWLLWRRFPLPPRWLINAAAVTGAVAISADFHAILGKDSGVALLTLFLALKLFETRSVRDAFAVVLLGLFLILSQFFYSQSMVTLLAAGIATLLFVATMIGLQRSVTPLRQGLSQAAFMLVQAIPVMLLLFFFFPRIAGPLWGSPSDSPSGTSGLSDSMSPGTISQLSLSDAIAFRVRFSGAIPPRNQLYWRGPVLGNFDGLTWRMDRLLPQGKLPYVPGGKAYGYEMTLEPHNQRWLLALDYPSILLPDSFISPAFQLLASKEVRNRYRYSQQAFPETVTGLAERSALLRAALQLPSEGNPRSRALATALRDQYKSDGMLVAEFLSRIRREKFVYTLAPPKLGANTVDEFLFETRKGFCEHYASAFVYVMRAAGIPARVVTGYQGGEINPVDGYLEVRQSDAHAWAEIWLPNQGWQRIDPTAAIAPDRVEGNLASAVPGSDPLPLLARPELGWLRQWRYRWEALNNVWNQWVLGYDMQRQMILLQKLGWNVPDWQSLAAVMAASCSLVVGAMSLWVLRQHRRRDPLLSLWLRFERKMARLNLPRYSWEGPSHYATRLCAAHPDQAGEIRTICRLYESLRYGRVGAPPEEIRYLRRMITAFRCQPSALSRVANLR